MDKMLSFEYLLDSLMNWYSAKVGPEADNDLSVLKSLKLLFLVTAADIELNEGAGEEESKNLLIHTTFNKFFALPLGHVESEVYANITETRGHLGFFSINRSQLVRKADIVINNNNVDVTRINNAINYLKAKYPSIIKMEAYELVELTHKWNSWKFFYSTTAKNSSFIPSEVIIAETKFFA